ncbi:hypothetical protein AB0I51_16715 [Streptomyces sp. NPDC050549]|uniref:hypothetical protein n=1 Tax=Streptomyces sp. NPDC050549 TaxID=3155406 RepID=UPI003421070F
MVTAVTTISTPVEAVRHVLVAFDQFDHFNRYARYARWHPVPSLDTVPGRHSFTLGQLPDSSTELTDSEEFSGATAAELVPVLGRWPDSGGKAGVPPQPTR